MLPFILGGLAITSLAVWAFSGDDEVGSSPPKKRTILEKNFINLKHQINNDVQKKIVIFGQPGAGKSSLLLNITEFKCIPKPNTGQKTDTTNWHTKIKNSFFHKYQDLIYIDSPGYDTKFHPVLSYLNYFPFSSFDIFIFVINGKIHEADKKIIAKLKKISLSKKILIIRNFSENLTDKEKEEITIDMEKNFQVKSEQLNFIFASNRTKEGINKIKKLISLL